MFAANKSKYLAPSAFSSSCTRHNKMHNRSSDSAQNLFEKATKFKQTKLSLGSFNKRAKQDDSDRCELGAGRGHIPSKHETKAEFFLMPVPKPITAQQIVRHEYLNTVNGESSKGLYSFETVAVENLNESKSNSNSAHKNGRDMLALIGKVDFCLKIRKLYAELNIMWDVYGKLIKISNGCYRCQKILLLRNNDGGPVLQCIYYDFNNLLQQFQIGKFLRALGHFREHRLYAFKLQPITDSTKWEQHFTRIQNVTSFALLQRNNQNA